jgi:LemA protein
MGAVTWARPMLSLVIAPHPERPMSVTLSSKDPSVRPQWNRALIALAVVAAIAVAIGLSVASTYNQLVRLDQSVQGQWAQVENAYQRRADLVPNLVETVKGAADFEKQTLLAVTQARASIQQPTGGAPSSRQLEQFEQQQGALGSAMTRLLAVAEAYPQLKATEGFRDLQAQLEGTENRISVERMRFNEAAQAFNATRDSFPTNVAAGFFGERFAEKAYFHATEGASRPPPVHF